MNKPILPMYDRECLQNGWNMDENGWMSVMYARTYKMHSHTCFKIQNFENLGHLCKNQNSRRYKSSIFWPFLGHVLWTKFELILNIILNQFDLDLC